MSWSRAPTAAGLRGLGAVASIPADPALQVGEQATSSQHTGHIAAQVPAISPANRLAESRRGFHPSRMNWLAVSGPRWRLPTPLRLIGDRVFDTPVEQLDATERHTDVREGFDRD
ncbi:MAG: hypothetical protein ACLQBX_08350 [Candidatus Limnocylindrales bacterium]